MAKYRVKFTGPEVVIRQLHAKDESEKGVILPSDLEWSRNNRHSLILEDLDESAVDFFKGDDEFSISEIKEDAAPSKPAKP